MTFPRRLTLALLVLVGTATAGCSVKTTINTTSSSPANYSHVYVTVSGFAFNKSATARATDPGWVTVTLKTPVTVDLLDPDRALPTLVTDAVIPGGTYLQMQLQLIGSSAALATSATALGLGYNDEVTYTDSAGASHTVTLEFGTTSPTLLLPTSVVFGSGSAAVTSGSSEPTSLTLTTWFDMTRYLHVLNYGSQSSALYSGPVSAYDVTTVGGIKGSLDLSALGSAVQGGRQGIVATAEQLSADGTRRIDVGNATVQSDGSFLIYPLPVASGSGGTSYDVVLHGSAMEPMVVLSVPVSAGGTDKATELSGSALTAVPSATYSVNTGVVTTTPAGVVTTSGSSAFTTLPASASVDFYQTLPISSAPYLMESAALNPLTRQFDADWALPNSNVLVGTYNGGGSVAFSERTPIEGTGSYLLATRAPLRGAGPLDTRVSAPGRAQTVTVYPSPPLPASGSLIGVANGALQVQLSQATAGHYNTGTLIVSHGGVVIQNVDLTAAFAQAGASGTLAVYVIGLPTGTAAQPYLPAQYDVVARVWNSATPSTSLTFASLTNTLDLSAQIPFGAVITLP